jgi:general secretion pathway protein D
VGRNPGREEVSVAAIDKLFSISSSALPGDLFIHAAGVNLVRYLVKLCGFSLAILLALLASAATPPELFQQGQKAEKAGDIIHAYQFYLQASAADPSNLSYLASVQALRPRATLMTVAQSKTSDLSTKIDPIQIDPTLFGHITDQELEEARRPLPPAGLNLPSGRRDFDFRGDSKSLWEQVAAAMHLTVLFDTQYQPTRTLRFELTGADDREALRALEAATNSFLTPVRGPLIFVANDTTQKRNEFERTAAAVIPFSESENVQELQEISTSVRGVLDMQRLMVDTQRKLILLRDRATKVRLARRIFEDLMRPRAQVAIDVEILTTDQSSSLSYGMSPQTAFPLVNFSNKLNLMHAIPSGFTNFIGFGGGASLLGFGVTSAQLFATAAKSNTNSLLQAELVAMDGQPSTLHVGDKYPLVTNTYIGNTSGGGQVFAPPPTFTFEDLGLLLKVTPRVHGPDEVSLDLDVEFKLLGSATVDGIPIISSKKYESKVRLMTGQWAVLSGLMTASEARNISGLPILSLIPLFRNNSVSRDTGATLILLKPHIRILPPTEMPTWRAWTGTETRLPTDL